MSKTIYRSLILSLVAVTVIGLIISVWSYTGQQAFENEKTIVLNDRPQTKMEVDLSGLYPGMSQSYYIRLRANEGDRFGISMDFEKTGTDSLARFVDVEIRSCGETIADAKLCDYLGGQQVTFSVQFDHTSEVDVEIVYSMGSDVGDEAQNTTADFCVLLSAQR